MESAIFGLIGVALGAFLTVLREWWFQNRKNRTDAEFLAIQISCALERYAAQCVEVVVDDGLYQGQRDEENCFAPQVEKPKFDPESFKVEWKALPVKLMYEILDFPFKAELADQHISNVAEFAAPPYRETIEERQYQYAILGIAAEKLVKMLRKNAGIHQRENNEWNRLAFMEEKKVEIEETRAQRSNSP